MGRSTGNAGAAVFAAEGSGRHRLVRIGVVGGAALLTAWLIALALGVLGGFGSLPGLPGPSHPRGSSEASARIQHPVTEQPVASRTAAPVTTVAPSDQSAQSVSSDSTHPKASTPKASATPAVQQPSTPATSAAPTHGKSSAHTTQSTGKPAGSPGNGSGGSGAPGQLRQPH
jgi:hypothetical protein